MKQKNINILEMLLLLTAVSFALWPSYLAIKVDPYPGVNLTRLSIVLMVFVWVLVLLKERTYQVRTVSFIKNNGFLLGVIILPYFSWSILAALSSAQLQSSLYAALKDFFYFFMIFFLATILWSTPLKIVRFIRVMMFASVIIFLVAVIEFLLGQNMFMSFVPSNYVDYDSIQEGLTREGMYRAWGTFSHPLALARYSITMLPLALWYTYKSKYKKSFLGYFVTLALGTMIFLTSSRAGVGIIIFMFAGYISFNRFPEILKNARSKKSAFIVVILFILGLASAIGTYFVANELISGRNVMEADSTSARVVQMETGLPIVFEQPILGYGSGGVSDVFDIIVDNYYLSVALESGLIGLFLFIAMLVYFTRLAWKLHIKLALPYNSLATALMWSIIGNVIFMAILSLEQILPLMFLVFAMLISLDRYYLKSKFSSKLINYNV